MSRGRVRGGGHFCSPVAGAGSGYMGWQLGVQSRSTILGPNAPSECREELVEGVPKNLEQNRDSCHQCAIHRTPWAPSQGRVNYLPPLVPVGNQAGNEQRRAPAHFALFCLGKPVVLGLKPGSSAEMWNFPGKLQNHHRKGKTSEN